MKSQSKDVQLVMYGFYYEGDRTLEQVTQKGMKSPSLEMLRTWWNKGQSNLPSLTLLWAEGLGSVVSRSAFCAHLFFE